MVRRPFHQQPRQCLPEWGRLRDTFSAGLIRDGLRFPWWGDLPPRLPANHTLVLTPETARLVPNLLMQGAVQPCWKEGLKAVRGLIAVTKRSGGPCPALKASQSVLTDRIFHPTIATENLAVHSERFFLGYVCRPILGLLPPGYV